MASGHAHFEFGELALKTGPLNPDGKFRVRDVLTVEQPKKKSRGSRKRVVRGGPKAKEKGYAVHSLKR